MGADGNHELFWHHVATKLSSATIAITAMPIKISM